MELDEMKPVLEALLFASDAPITLERLSSIFDGAERSLIREALDDLTQDYADRSAGLSIDTVGGGYRLRTNVEHAFWIRKLLKSGPKKISRSAMETLSIVAYKQPLTRSELEAVRGVDSAGVLKTLMDRRLIKIIGRKDAPGRPVVYGTTREFLETFDLKDLGSLPSLKDIEMPEDAEEFFSESNELDLFEENPAVEETTASQSKAPEETDSETNTELIDETPIEEAVETEPAQEEQEEADAEGQITEDNSGSGNSVETGGGEDDGRGEGQT